jgi:hypothetical protein
MAVRRRVNFIGIGIEAPSDLNTGGDVPPDYFFEFALCLALTAFHVIVLANHDPKKHWNRA